MKLVLVAGLNPRVAKNGPKVRLYEGWWKVATEHHEDCELALCCNTLPPKRISDGDKFQSFGETFWLSVSKTGTEDFINVFAESVNVPVLATTT